MCYLASAVSLKALDVSRNALPSLFECGLGACTTLQVLNAEFNMLASPLHAALFALLPALRVLDVRGNPFTASPHTRCCVCAFSGPDHPCTLQVAVLTGIFNDLLAQGTQPEHCYTAQDACMHYLCLVRVMTKGKEEEEVRRK
jgi:hypothetical protein